MFSIRYNNFSITLDNGWRISVAFDMGMKLVDAQLAGKVEEALYTNTDNELIEVAIVREGERVRDDAIFYCLDQRKFLRLCALAQCLPNRDLREDEDFPIAEDMLEQQYVLKRVKNSI